MASSSIVSPRVPIQAIKKLDTFNDNCYYPIRAISFLATFAMFEELPAQSIVFANGTLMNEDVKALADAEILDSRLTPRFQQIVTQYHRIVEKCVILRNTVDNVYGALPKSRKDCVLVPQDPSYHADPSYHTTFHAFSYLCIYGVTAGAAPEPTDKVVDCTAIKLIEDITKIDDEVEGAVGIDFPKGNSAKSSFGMDFLETFQCLEKTKNTHWNVSKKSIPNEDLAEFPFGKSIPNAP